MRYVIPRNRNPRTDTMKFLDKPDLYTYDLDSYYKALEHFKMKMKHCDSKMEFLPNGYPTNFYEPNTRFFTVKLENCIGNILEINDDNVVVYLNRTTESGLFAKEMIDKKVAEVFMRSLSKRNDNDHKIYVSDIITKEIDLYGI